MADSTMERVAIPWLHVVRENPVFLKKYKEIVNNKSKVKDQIQSWIRVIKNKIWWFYQLGKSLLADRKLWHGQQDFNSQIDILLVSHLINSAHAGQPDDFYFGNLPNELVVQGYNVVICLINHTKLSPAEIAKKWVESNVPRVILSEDLGILDEIDLHIKLKNESKRLKQLALMEPTGLLHRVIKRVTDEVLSSGAHSTMRMSKEIYALVSKMRPKLVVVTHEGHAWERIFFASARRAYPSVRCIGYQHAAVFRLQHALIRKLTSQYNPDHILTAGSISKCRLENEPDLKGIPISILGSNRNLNSDKINAEREAMALEGFNNLTGRVCLVIPEGTLSECQILFDFSLQYAQLYPEIQFIWRMHPILPFELLKSQNGNFKNLPENITISGKTIEEDIARSRWALYRGSTAIIQAVVAGLRPVYLAIPDELTIDPLYEVGPGRVIVKSVAEFHEAILLDLDVPKTQLGLEFKNLQKYCENFFTPFNPKNLLELIY